MQGASQETVNLKRKKLRPRLDINFTTMNMTKIIKKSSDINVLSLAYLHLSLSGPSYLLRFETAPSRSPQQGVGRKAGRGPGSPSSALQEDFQKINIASSAMPRDAARPKGSSLSTALSCPPLSPLPNLYHMRDTAAPLPLNNMVPS